MSRPRAIVERIATSASSAVSSIPTVRSASKTNVGSSRVPVTSGRAGPSSLGRPSRKLTSTAVRKRGSNIEVDHLGGQAIHEVVHRRERRVRRRVATQAEQQEVAGSVRMERRLGVEHEVRARRRGRLAVGVGGGRHDVLHDPAAVLGHVSDRLAETPRDRQEHEFGRQVLGDRCGRGRRCRRELADRRVADQQGAGAMGRGDESQERGVDLDRAGRDSRAPRGGRGPRPVRRPSERRRSSHDASTVGTVVRCSCVIVFTVTSSVGWGSAGWARLVGLGSFCSGSALTVPD